MWHVILPLDLLLTMKAVVCTRYGAPEVLQLRDVPKPVPSDMEVLIKVRATTVTAADFRIRSFTVPMAFWLPARLAFGLTKPKNPILGVELAGEVVEVGSSVTRFAPGDKVFAASIKSFGAYAEYICLSEDDAIAKMPEGLSYSEAAALPIGARTALHFLRKVDNLVGKRVLIYGASGSVGTYAVQLASHFGAHVTGVCSSSNLELVRSLGADRVIDYSTGDLAKKLGWYDVIFIAVDKCPFPLCNESLKLEGVYMNITAPLKSPAMFWTSLTTKKKVITGESSPESAEDLQHLKELVETGVIKPVIDRSYSLKEIVKAHRYVDQGHKKGNVVVEVS